MYNHKPKREHFVYDETNNIGWDLKSIRPAELYLVEMEFNEMNIIGRPSAAALKWLKPGMELKVSDCRCDMVRMHENHPSDSYKRYTIKCLVCHAEH